MIGFPFSRTGMYIAAAVLAVAMIWGYGKWRYNDGVTDTTAKFLKADREGADNVRSIAREVLDGIGSNSDVDELLRDTGGLRD